MYVKVKDILKNPEEYKVCNECGEINSKENIYCWYCEYAGNLLFNENTDCVIERINEYYKCCFREGLTKEEVDNIEMQIS
jgi:hypothetical protein